MRRLTRTGAALVLGLLIAGAAHGAGWDAVRRIAPDAKVKVGLCGGKSIDARLVSAGDNAVIVRSGSGEQSLARRDIRGVRVADPARRVRNGLIWTGAGAASGLVAGVAVCTGCANEGAGGKYTAPLAAAGAGLGAITGFLRPAYRTIYEANCPEAVP